jgi:hypothetical protein
MQADSLDTLFDTPTLSQYVRWFYQAGFDDLGYILSMDAEEWDEMLTVIAAECEQAGLIMRAGHRMQILSKLRKERARHDTFMHQQTQGFSATGVGAGVGVGAGAVGGPPGSGATIVGGNVHTHVDVMQVNHRLPPKDDSITTDAYVFYDGFTCLSMHWSVCAVASVSSLFFGLFILLLLELKSDIANADDRDGAWTFVEVLMIIAYVLSCLTCLLGVYAYRRDPSETAVVLPQCIENCLNGVSCDCRCCETRQYR